MTTITFASPDIATAFMYIAEGLEEVHREHDDTTDADAFAKLAEAVVDQPQATPGRFTVTLPATLQAAAEAVLAECLDASSRAGPGEFRIGEGDVIIT